MKTLRPKILLTKSFVFMGDEYVVGAGENEKTYLTYDRENWIRTEKVLNTIIDDAEYRRFQRFVKKNIEILLFYHNYEIAASNSNC